jgi:hypothetical protein
MRSAKGAGRRFYRTRTNPSCAVELLTVGQIDMAPIK